ncbi:hypothetical protein R6242_04175 [Iodobacter sp. CM08]|uniref:hypothetical protein n=1 Tax=Iodobacter sp. CM08 TaxID=3085902 RepID=UPI002981CD8F|nr:hypothetical protein [Iodobacter sp. CM08]MDW5415767.1 hypothetical protein [Iodobacter sp. CM08]
MKRLLIALGLALAWRLWPQPQISAPPQAQQTASTATPRQSIAASDWLKRFYPDAGNTQQAAPPAYIAAAESMADARINGDPRTPPIIRSNNSEAATPAELADHPAYKQYEARQNLRELAAFSAAVPEKIRQLREDINRGRAAGIAPELIAGQEEKVLQLEEMRSQLITEHPEISATH